MEKNGERDQSSQATRISNSRLEQGAERLVFLELQSLPAEQCFDDVETLRYRAFLHLAEVSLCVEELAVAAHTPKIGVSREMLHQILHIRDLQEQPGA